MGDIFKNSLIKDCVTVGDKIAVAVSGGIDSMVLLHAFMKEADYLGITFFVINIEHGIRGETSQGDSDFVKNFCKNNQIEFIGKSINVPAMVAESGMTVEECARLLRYNVFQQLIDEKKCTKVALAHHMSDQAETVLMRIIRGTGLKGLMGMKKISGNYIRPFLNVTKEEIIEIQKTENIPFRIDETNFDNTYTRNLLRNEIIPSLKKLSLDAESGLVRLTRIAAEAEEFIGRYDNPIEIEGENARLKFIEDEADILFKRRIQACFEAVGIKKDIEERHFDILKDFTDCKNGSRLDMPYGVIVYKEYDSLLFTKEIIQNTDLIMPFTIGKIAFGTQIIKIEKYNGKKLNSGELVFDITKIPETAVFRTRRDGDFFTKFGGGTKSLGDYLTDKKVPLRLRDSLIVCADKNEILFIVNLEISNRVRADFTNEKNKNNIYKITVEA